MMLYCLDRVTPKKSLLSVGLSSPLQETDDDDVDDELVREEEGPNHQSREEEEQTALPNPFSTYYTLSHKTTKFVRTGQGP